MTWHMPNSGATNPPSCDPSCRLHESDGGDARDGDQRVPWPPAMDNRARFETESARQSYPGKQFNQKKEEGLNSQTWITPPEKEGLWCQWSSNSTTLAILCILKSGTSTTSCRRMVALQNGDALCVRCLHQLGKCLQLAAAKWCDAGSWKLMPFPRKPKGIRRK